MATCHRIAAGVGERRSTAGGWCDDDGARSISYDRTRVWTEQLLAGNWRVVCFCYKCPVHRMCAVMASAQQADWARIWPIGWSTASRRSSHSTWTPIDIAAGRTGVVSFTKLHPQSIVFRKFLVARGIESFTSTFNWSLPDHRRPAGRPTFRVSGIYGALKKDGADMQFRSGKQMCV